MNRYDDLDAFQADVVDTISARGLERPPREWLDRAVILLKKWGRSASEVADAWEEEVANRGRTVHCSSCVKPITPEEKGRHGGQCEECSRTNSSALREFLSARRGDSG